MRKNVKSLAPTLWIVIAAFIVAIFAVWGGAGRLGETRSANIIVFVGKEKISTDSYYQNLRERLEILKKDYQSLTKEFIQQLNIPQQVLEQMIQQILLLQLARDMGIGASAEEIREKIISYPVFQKDGKFIGFEEYRQILDWNRIPLADFEENLKREITLNKVIRVLTAGITITQEELFSEYKKANESAKLEYLVLEKSKIELPEKPLSSEVQAYFEKSREKYKIPEKRAGSYVFLKVTDLRKEIELSDSEIADYYKDNQDLYKVPEKIKVSRIFLPLGNKEKAPLLVEAQSLLERLAKGEDFGELARKYSADEKAKDGGDWGLSEWKSLSSKEQEEIQKLDAGKTSGVVELEGGVSILKVTEKEPASTQPLEEVKERIKNTLLDQKARNLAGERIARLERSSKKEKSLDVASQKTGFKIKTTGLLKEGEALEDFDPSGSISQSLFKLKEKEISSPIYAFEGVGIAQLEKIEAPRPATFEEVKAEVEKDVSELGRKEKALEKIKEIRESLEEKNWEDIAQKNKLEYKSVNEHKREQYLSLIGESPEADQVAFSLPLNEVSQPIEFENGYALLRVLERKETTPEDFEKNKKTEKENLLAIKKNKFLHSYLAKIREEKGVKIKYDLFLKVNSDVLSRFEEE